jgi:hypothetical protein
VGVDDRGACPPVFVDPSGVRGRWVGGIGRVVTVTAVVVTGVVVAAMAGGLRLPLPLLPDEAPSTGRPSAERAGAPAHPGDTGGRRPSRAAPSPGAVAGRVAADRVPGAFAWAVALTGRESRGALTPPTAVPPSSRSTTSPQAPPDAGPDDHGRSGQRRVPAPAVPREAPGPQVPHDRARPVPPVEAPGVSRDVPVGQGGAGGARPARPPGRDSPPDAAGRRSASGPACTGAAADRRAGDGCR